MYITRKLFRSKVGFKLGLLIIVLYSKRLCIWTLGNGLGDYSKNIFTFASATTQQVNGWDFLNGAIYCSTTRSTTTLCVVIAQYKGAPPA